MNGEIGLKLAPTAPSESVVTEYDRQHFGTYARLVTAEDAGWDWRRSATDILGLDVAADEAGALTCWRSHMDRARWIATDGFTILARSAGFDGIRPVGLTERD